MRGRGARFAALVCAAGFAGGGVAASAQLSAVPSGVGSDVLAVQGVRVFDGAESHTDMTVIVRDGRIVAMGRDLALPAGAGVVDGTGRTLLPGFIDAHTHVFSAAHLREALMWGVTTELDQFTDPGFAATMRAEQAAGNVTERADLFSAGVLATAPGGHGSQFGIPIPTVSDASQAAEFVAARKAEGSDWIKIVWEDGSTYGMTTPSLGDAAVGALVEAAHAQGLKAMVHVATRATARRAVELGADGLVHAPHDGRPAVDFGRFVSEHEAFLTPTLTVVRSIATGEEGRIQTGDPRLGDALDPAAGAALETTFPIRDQTRQAFEHAAEAVQQVWATGGLVLAGTDAPNPGTAHGLSLHRELELLVEAGLPATAALAAATLSAATAFDLPDRGRIREGARADLVLVDGDPTTDITATRNLLAVWRNGAAVDLVGERERIRAAASAVSAALPVPGPVSNFDDASLASAFGAGWSTSTDAMAGGSSTATLTPEAGALKVSGEVVGGAPNSWAGAMFFPGAVPMTPADASAATGLRMRLRGDAGTPVTVMIFSQGTGMAPAFVAVQFTGDWQDVELPFADFAGATPESLMGIFVGLSGRAGPFTIWLDDVMFY